MSSFLNSFQLATLTGVFRNHWETFSSGIGNYVTVYKAPTQVINNPDSINFDGYGPDNNGSVTDITYIENSRQIPCQILYPKDMNTLPFAQLRLNLDTNDLMIKVDQDGADYLNAGKNERIIVNGQTYNPNDSFNVQNYFGLKFYYYKLVITK